MQKCLTSLVQQVKALQIVASKQDIEIKALQNKVIKQDIETKALVNNMKDCAYNFSVCRHTQVQLSQTKAQHKSEIDNINRRVTQILEAARPAKRAKVAKETIEAKVHTLYDTNGTAALKVAELPTEAGVAVTIPLTKL